MHSDRQAEVANAAGTIAFIGGGNMARSLIGGLLARGREPAAIHVAEPHAPFRAALARDFSVHVHADNIEAGERLAARGNQKVLVLTSGGVISRLAQAALGASDRSAVDLNLSLRNSGLCEFHSRPYGLALGSWNALPHLHDSRELWTYY